MRGAKAQELWGLFENKIDLTEIQKYVVSSYCEQRRGTKRVGEIAKELGITHQGVSWHFRAIYKKCRKYLLNDLTFFREIFDFILQEQNRWFISKGFEEKISEVTKLLEGKKKVEAIPKEVPYDVSIYPHFSLYETIFCGEDEELDFFNHLKINKILRWDGPVWARPILAENPIYIDRYKSNLFYFLVAEHLRSSPLSRTPIEAPIKCPNCRVRLELSLSTIQVTSRQLKINKTWECPQCSMKFRKLGMPNVIHKFRGGGDYVRTQDFSDWGGCSKDWDSSRNSKKI